MKKITILLIFLLTPASSFAVNFYDGARAPKGMYFLTYSSYYYADTTTDADGGTAKRDYRYGKFEETLRLCYYTPDLVLTALVPAGNVHSGYYGQSSGGIGDMKAGAGYFLPWRGADILPMIFVKFPTGEYASDKAVNYGSNQYDIQNVVFLYKQLGKASVDAAGKYFFRRENRATGISPGDEIHLQGLLGWQFSRQFKAGLSANWMRSTCQENHGARTPGTARETFSAGAEMYLRLPGVGVTFTYLRDLYAENSAKGDFFQIKTCAKF